MIRTDSDEYFIEPLERGTQEQEDQGRVHLVYRRSALLQATSNISADYQPKGRTMIAMGTGSGPEGITSTAASSIVIHSILYKY